VVGPDWEGPDSAGHQESVPLLPITHVLRSCGYRSIRKRLGVRVFLEGDGLSVLDGPDHRGIRGKFSTRRFVPSFINFCTRTACTPHISSSAAASDSGGFAFFWGSANSATFDVARYRTLSSQENIWDKEQREQ
jgi:hypothetical protein